MSTCARPDCSNQLKTGRRFCSPSCATKTAWERKHRRTLDEALWSHVDMTGGPYACWLWLKQPNNSGYGALSAAGQHMGAHVAAWVVTFGSLPPDGNGRKSRTAHVLHHCDVRLCCNPKHLFLGTNKVNQADCSSKGRQNGLAKRHIGASHGRAKLTDDQVRYVRLSTERGIDLAAALDVSKGLISQVRTGRIWRHLLPA